MKVTQPAKLALQTVARVGDVPAADWDACAGDDPFVSHAFLDALEESGSACAKQGWMPQHLVAEQAGALAGVAPLYLKSNSLGEYVFDWAWAEAWERCGLPYYPKLQCCVPFTPVGGRRLLVRPGAAADATQRLLAMGMLELVEALKLSSLHLTFMTEAEQDLCAKLGLLRRVGLQYHWQNRGYRCFEDFLGELLGRKRKAIRRERKWAADTGVKHLMLVGDDIKAHHWDAFYGFYRNTVGRKWARPYLTRDFFARIGEAMPQQLVLMMAEDDGQLVAGALNLKSERVLYGRYWGASHHHKGLHFESCYYRAIDVAIEMGLERVEAGAQGEHKVQRGYLPVITHSAHHVDHPELRMAVGDFLNQERRAVMAEMEALQASSPFAADRANAKT